jgi:hypothetical protein
VSHENPMETHLNEEDVEIFDQSKLLDSSNAIEQLQKENEIETKKKERMFEQIFELQTDKEIEPKKKEKIFNESSALSDRVDQNPFLSVLRQAADKKTRQNIFLLHYYRVFKIQYFGSGIRCFLTPWIHIWDSG